MIVDGVPSEASAEMVVDAAVRHLLERELDHEERVGPVRARVMAQQEVHDHTCRELGRAAEAALLRVERPRDVGERLVERLLVEPAALVGQLDRRTERVEHGRRVPVDVVAARAVGLGDRAQHRAEARHSVALDGREVGAAVERYAVGPEEDRERPSAASRHHLHRLHVYVVDVGALLAINLHVDEQLVHHGGGRLVFEALVRHDVAPVARAVADAEQDRLVLGLCALDRLLAPRVPVDRVVLVLKEVRARLVGESVRVCVICHRHPSK